MSQCGNNISHTFAQSISWIKFWNVITWLPPCSKQSNPWVHLPTSSKVWTYSPRPGQRLCCVVFSKCIYADMQWCFSQQLQFSMILNGHQITYSLTVSSSQMHTAFNSPLPNPALQWVCMDSGFHTLDLGNGFDWETYYIANLCIFTWCLRITSFHSKRIDIPMRLQIYWSQIELKQLKCWLETQAIANTVEFLNHAPFQSLHVSAKCFWLRQSDLILESHVAALGKPNATWHRPDWAPCGKKYLLGLLLRLGMLFAIVLFGSRWLGQTMKHR